MFAIETLSRSQTAANQQSRNIHIHFYNVKQEKKYVLLRVRMLVFTGSLAAVRHKAETVIAMEIKHLRILVALV